MIVQHVGVRWRQHKKILGHDLDRPDLRRVSHGVLPNQQAPNGYQALGVYSQSLTVKLEQGAHGMNQLASCVGGIHSIHSPPTAHGTRREVYHPLCVTYTQAPVD
jgi:hypothetical protein